MMRNKPSEMTYLPSIPNGTLFDIFLQYPDFSEPLHVFLENLLRGPSPFSEAEREMIASYVSGLNECRFCCTAHTAVAEALGTPEGLVRQLVDNDDLPGVEEKFWPVLRYVRKLTKKPASIEQSDIDAILEAGWTEEAVVHANLICGAFNLFNRWVEGLGVDASPNYVKASVKQLLAGGYLGVNEMIKGILTNQRKPEYRSA